MLHLLKRRDSQNAPYDVFGQLENTISPAPAFDPLKLPSYFGGYTMNLKTDIPQGSIDPAPSGVWFDAKNIDNALVKNMQRGNPTVTTLVNGFKAENININTARFRNSTTDLFTGITNFTFVLGFNHAASVAGHMIFAVKNTPDTAAAWLYLRPSRKLEISLFVGGVQAVVPTVNNYDDGAWHCVVCTIDQTNKTVTMLTDTGETVTNTNALIGAPLALTNNDQNFCQFGGWWPVTFFYSPGKLGDILFFNTVLSAGTIANLMTWEKTRLGI